MDQSKIIQQFRTQWNNPLHIFHKPLTVIGWTRKHKPFVWSKLCSSGDKKIELWVDTGYGHYALIEPLTDTVLGMGSDFVLTEHYFACGDVYGFPNGIIYKRI
jgi:hypothetical protein